VIGSMRTGRNVVVCNAHTDFSKGQMHHPHPYVTPDLKWIIFNSGQTGTPQVFAARVPEEMVAAVGVSPPKGA
jgi:hypothetical protein